MGVGFCKVENAGIKSEARCVNKHEAYVTQRKDC